MGAAWGRGIGVAIVLAGHGCIGADSLDPGGAPRADAAANPNADAAGAAPDGHDAAPDASGSDAAPGDDHDLLRLDHVQVRGTHNSYHLAPAVPFHDSHRYSHAPLDVQLAEQGVRAFELDLHRDDAGSQALSVYHIALIDAETTCARFEDCLAAIKTWSDAHHEHLPVFVWLELKDSTGGFPIDDLSPADAAIRSVFPDDQLLTPDDLQAGHASPRARIEADGWPTLREVRGRVMFIVLSQGDAAEAYSDGHTTLAGRAMFLRAGSDQYDLPWAVVTKINNPAAADAIAAAHAARLLIASNVCNADESDAACAASLAAGMANGVHMLKDDFPAPVASRAYWLDLPDGNPARCNEVTAPVACTAAALEDL